MNVTSMDKYESLRSKAPQLADEAEAVADLLESHGMGYFNQAIFEVGAYTDEEVNEILSFLEEVWPKGKELRAQDNEFLSSKMEELSSKYGMSRASRKRSLEKKATPQQRRQLTNLYDREELFVIRHNYNIDSITQLTSVQADRLIKNKINILLRR